MGETAMARFGKCFRPAVVLAAAGLLGACALADVAVGPPPSLYVLKAPAPGPARTASPVAAQIVVEDFVAPAAIDTTRIVFQPNENEIAYYANARWSDRAPRVISSLLVETLTGTGHFPAIIGPGSNVRMDYALVGDIRSFSARRDAEAGQGQGTTKVRVAFYVRLLRARDRSIVAAREFSSEAAASGGGMANVVAAYDDALGAVLGEIADWTLEQSIAAGAGS